MEWRVPVNRAARPNPVCAALFLVALMHVSCAQKRVTVAPDTKHIQTLQRSGRFEAALAEAQAGLDQNRDQSTKAYWAFLIEKADVVYRRDGAKAAGPLLAPEPPAAPEFAPVRARRKMLQGWIEYSGGRFATAETLWEDGLSIAKSAGAHEQAAGLEFSMVQLLSRQHRADAAELLVRDGNRHSAATHDPHLAGYGMNTLAIWLIDQSRYEEAIPLLERAYAMSDPKGDVAFNSLSNLGLCLYRLGEFDQSLAVLRKIEAASLQGDAAKIPVETYGNLGNVYAEREDYPTALRYYTKALKAAEETGEKSSIGNWLGSLAHISIQTSNWTAAESYNTQALAVAKELSDRTLELYSLCDSARILNGRGDYASAVKLFQEVAHAENYANRLPALRAHAGLARLYSARGMDELADHEFEAAVNIVEDRRSALKEDKYKILFLSALISAHQDYIDFLMSRGKNQKALEIAEASRARILQDRLGDSNQTAAFSAAAYQRLAGQSGTILLSYSLGRERSYMWVTTGSGIVSYPLPSKDNIQSLVERYRAFIDNIHDPLDTEESSGPELYKVVLEPALEHIPPGSHLIIAADLGLHALNFETLPVPAPRKHYFLEDATITMVPSLNMLMGHQSNSSRAVKLLLIGDPSSTDEHFPKLPYAAKEIALVQGHFAAQDVTDYRESAAVPAVYQGPTLNGFSYIHFTAHASADRESPLDSAIILSGQEGANKLTAREVLKHPLNAELVTISACQGAGARTYTGEGLVGFMWAFFQTGARNIIAGLWDVSDESTPLLMDQLYAGIATGRAPAEALRQAKLELRKANPIWSLPYYWAPFQLYSREVGSKSQKRGGAAVEHTADSFRRARQR